ncbi:MAG: hypothetical protein ACR2MB_05995 [Acidimicrobiales bacterium]
MSIAPPPRLGGPFGRRAAGFALLAALVVAGCTKSDGGGSSKPHRTKVRIGDAATVDRPTSTTVAAPTTAATAATSTGPTAPPAPEGLESPKAAAQRLYDTWKAGDRPSALVVATPEAVDGIWATAPGDYSLYNDCDSAEFDTSGCLFRGNSGTIQFTMERHGAAWVVIEALFAEP